MPTLPKVPFMRPVLYYAFLREISTSLLLELHIKVLKYKFYRVCALYFVYRKVQSDTNVATVDT